MHLLCKCILLKYIFFNFIDNAPEASANDPNDFGVSLTERIKRRKRAAQSSETNEKNNDESNYNLKFTVLDIDG